MTFSQNAYMGRDVGVRLRHARKLRGLTQQELAAKSKVPQSAISEVETGESKAPSGTNLIALAQTLEVSPKWLAQGRGEMEELGSPLPADAIEVARDWLKLGPEARGQVSGLLKTLVKASSADIPAVSDAKVEAAYGSTKSRSKTRG